jgi:Zn-dependent metalloprotease
MSVRTLLRFAVLMSFASVLAPGVGSAEVRIYHSDRPTDVLNRSPQLPASAFERSTGKLNKGTASQAFLSWLNQEKSWVGLQKVDGETLVLQRVQQENDRISLHYRQRFQRTAIEGAELIAVFSGEGTLLTLNSSLVELQGTGFTVQPEVSRAVAWKAAVKAGGFQEPEAGEGSRDGLLIVTPKKFGRKSPRLVWQFSIREYGDQFDGSEAREIQVAAQSTAAGKAGSIFKVRSLAHSAWSPEVAPVKIYDSSITLLIPNPYYKGVLVMENGEKTFGSVAFRSDEARKAHSSFARVLDFYDHHFDRQSFDGQSGLVSASVNVQRIGFLDVLGQKQNAAWMGPWKMFIFGAGGEMLGNFAEAIDVVGHEFTHAVVGSTSDLIYEGQSGALNEHLADVFGALIEQEYEPWLNPFLLGETVLRGKAKEEAAGLRDLLNPEKGLSAQPGKVSETPAEFGPDCVASQTNDNCGVHILSGIPNRAFALLLKDLDPALLRDLYYRVMTQRLRSNSDFADYRKQMLDECSLGFEEAFCDRVEAALDEVEIRSVAQAG